MSTTGCSTCRRTVVTVCMAAAWVNVATTPASQIPARTALHARLRRQRCSTASAPKDSGVRCRQMGAPVLRWCSSAVSLMVKLRFVANHGYFKRFICKGIRRFFFFNLYIKFPHLVKTMFMSLLCLLPWDSLWS